MESTGKAGGRIENILAAVLYITLLEPCPWTLSKVVSSEKLGMDVGIIGR